MLVSTENTEKGGLNVMIKKDCVALERKRKDKAYFKLVSEVEKYAITHTYDGDAIVRFVRNLCLGNLKLNVAFRTIDKGLEIINRDRKVKNNEFK